MADDDLSRLKIEKTHSVTASSRQKRRYLYWVGAAVLVVLLALFYSMGIFSSSTRVDVATVALIYPSQTFTLLNASGYVVAQRKAAVASKITGRLVSLTVEEGSRIKKDQVIAQLENDDIAASRKQAVANLEVARFNLEQAKAELNDAKNSYEREKTLFVQEFTSKASYDAAEARYRKAVAGVSGGAAGVSAAKAALTSAEASLQYTYIRAPFDAVVLTKNADVGDIVTPLGAAANAKASAVTIADMRSLMVEADVSESNLEKVKLGQPCEIQLDAIPGLRFRGAVHMIVPTADRSKATVMVKVRFVDNDSRILPEMSAKVAFLSREIGTGDEKPRTAVNQKALVEHKKQKYLFLVSGNRVAETAVSTGIQLGDMVEIMSGAKSAQKVVINPPSKLRDGDRIKSAEQ
jgi:RND family efflux transporter MFP subunit